MRSDMVPQRRKQEGNQGTGTGSEEETMNPLEWLRNRLVLLPKDEVDANYLKTKSMPTS